MEAPPGEQTSTDPIKIPKADDPRSTAENDKDKADDGAKQDPPKPDTKKPDALGLSGELDNTVKGKTNVTLTVWMGSMRSHPSAEDIKPLFTCGLLGSTFQRAGVEPMRDLDGVMFAGPQLNDLSKYTVAVRHHIGEKELHDAVDKLVQGKGKWIDSTAARIFAVKSNRVVFPHSKTLLFVTPEQGWEQVRAIRTPLALPQSKGRVLSLNLLKPSIPLRKLGLHLPDTLEEMRLDIYLSSTGTGEVRFVFEDKDEAQAAKHASVVAAQVKDFVWQLRRVGQISSAVGSKSAASAMADLPTIEFVASEKQIVSEVQLSQEQVSSLLARLPTWMCAHPKAAPAGSTPPQQKSAPPAGSAKP